jgi:NADPH2:quinone reductase
MKAVLIERGPGDAARPVLREIDTPAPGPREVLVRVHAAALNRADLALKTGHFRAGAGTGSERTAGLEMAGQVVACGPSVTRVVPGQRVMAMCAGAHAESVCVDERLLLTIPGDIDYVHAACLPVALMTAHDALVTNGRLRPGNNVFVQAASTAVGIAAVQIASVLGANVVIGTSNSSDKRKKLEAMGVIALAGDCDTLADEVRAHTEGRGVDVVIDHIGDGGLAIAMDAAAPGGRIISVGRMRGTRASIDLDLLSLKRLALIGVTFRTRDADDVAALIAAMQADLWAALRAGRISMPMDSEFTLFQIEDAHHRMRSGDVFGKVVLRVSLDHQ